MHLTDTKPYKEKTDRTAEEKDSSIVIVGNFNTPHAMIDRKIE